VASDTLPKVVARAEFTRDDCIELDHGYVLQARDGNICDSSHLERVNANDLCT
jgi:hypothetical protein